MARRPVLSAVGALALAVTACAAGTSGASAATTPAATTPPAHRATVDPNLAHATGQVTAFVRLDARSGRSVAAAGGSAKAVRAARAHTDAVAQDVVPHALTRQNTRTAEVKRFGTTANLVPGTLVTGDAANVRALADDPDVVAIYRVTPKKLANAREDAFTGAVQAWSNAHATGRGVRIAIIDTGIDYTHADFGGAGTPAAYALADANDGTKPLDPSLYDADKLLGGYDFAGPTYDADAGTDGLTGTTDTPTPDANPIDSPYRLPGGNEGHGTHVAGIAAGYGVDASGHAFTGDHRALTDVSDWQIGPGTAPEAGIYAFKIFGDLGGSTSLTALALDRAADPNGDGDLSDHVDVVNLSLGSDGGPADTADDLFVDQLSALGTLVVTAAGNGGDVQDVAGDPGNAQSALSVANSVGGPQVYDGVRVTAPAAVAGTYAAQSSVSYTGTTDREADVVLPDPADRTFDGCSPDDFTPAVAARVKGKIAYLAWSDDGAQRACSSSVRFDNAQAAGAVGVLLPGTADVPGGALGGDATIPGAELTPAAAATLEPAIAAASQGGPAVHAEIGPHLVGTVTQDLASDVLNPSSSRGDHGSLGRSGPDVAAPGTDVVSAASGTGTGAQSLTGTSMASPHVAGIAADVLQAHPGWTPAQVKAAIENTATHDVSTAKTGGVVYGPQRTGAGRVDALAAVTDDVVAYDSQRPSQVGVTFGVVPVGTAPVTAARTVTVTNLGDADASYDAAFARSTTVGAASITVSPAHVEVGAHRSATVTLTLHATSSTLSRDLDPTQQATQSGYRADFVAQLTGRLVLAPTGATTTGQLRVPVQAAPRPVSALHASSVRYANAASSTASLAITGTGYARPGGWTSLVTPLVLGATSPKLEDQDLSGSSVSAVRSGDVRAVGWASNVPAVRAAHGSASAEQLAIGVQTDGDWASLGQAVNVMAEIDVDRDGLPDLELVVEKLPTADGVADVTLADTYDWETGDLLDSRPVSGLTGATDTGVFDDDVVVATVGLAAAGIPATARPAITVWTYSGLAPDGTQVMDVAPTFVANLGTPPYWFDRGASGSFSFAATAATSLTVHRTAGAASSRLLVLEPGNSTAVDRAQVVSLTVPPPTATTTHLTAGKPRTAGVALPLTAGVTPATATGTVTFYDGTKRLASAAVHGGKATAAPRLAAGKHTLRAVYTPASAAWTTSVGTSSVTVAKAASTTKASLTHRVAWYGTRTSVVVKVAGHTVAPSGTVQVKQGSRLLASGKVKVSGKTGAVTIALPRTLTVGRHTLTVTYRGNANAAASHATVIYTVTR